MSKIARKIVIPISLMMIGIMVLSIFVNSFFIQRYNVYKQAKELGAIYTEVLKLEKNNLAAELLNLEQTYDVTIVTFGNTTNSEKFNASLRDEFYSRNIFFTQLWLGEDGYAQLQANHAYRKIYSQGKLHYSIMVQYAVDGDTIYAIARNIPHTSEMIKMINAVTFVVFTVSGLLIFFLMSVFIKKVTNPLIALTTLTKDISNLDFRKIEVHTKDEIETLATSFNFMSERLQIAQSDLEESNQSMKNLLSNVSHELKTPVALIKAYISGIKDGLDDGSFLDEITIQNEKIDTIIETLLNLSQIESKALQLEEVSLSMLVSHVIEDCEIMLDAQPLKVAYQIDPNIMFLCDKNDIQSAITNLVTNAIKYGVDFISIFLRENPNHITFEISNGMDPGVPLNMDEIWVPFYVGEESRNKSLSGNGLGLSIVKAILERHGFYFGCEKTNDSIRFFIQIKKKKDDT